MRRIGAILIVVAFAACGGGDSAESLRSDRDNAFDRVRGAYELLGADYNDREVGFNEFNARGCRADHRAFDFTTTVPMGDHRGAAALSAARSLQNEPDVDQVWVLVSIEKGWIPIDSPELDEVAPENDGITVEYADGASLDFVELTNRPAVNISYYGPCRPGTSVP